MTRTFTANRWSMTVLACALFVWAASQQPSWGGFLSRDINTYVLFANSELDFKGRDADPTRGFIIGGNVGVNLIDPTPDNSSRVLNLDGGGSPHVVVLSDGSQVAGDSMNLGGPDVSVWEAFSNFPSAVTATADIRSPPLQGFSYATATEAIIAGADLPSLPVFSPGAIDVTVENDDMMTLPVGNYFDVRVKDGGTINLLSGTYNFHNFLNGKNVTINTMPGTVVQIEADFSTNNGSFIGSADGARFVVGSVGVGHNDASISFGRNTEAHGQFYAPNGILNLGHSTDLYGRFWANQIGSDFNVNVTFAVPEPATSMLALWGAACLLIVARRRLAAS